MIYDYFLFDSNCIFETFLEIGHALTLYCQGSTDNVLMIETNVKRQKWKNLMELHMFIDEEEVFMRGMPMKWLICCQCNPNYVFLVTPVVYVITAFLLCLTPNTAAQLMCLLVKSRKSGLLERTFWYLIINFIPFTYEVRHCFIFSVIELYFFGWAVLLIERCWLWVE